jgi:hypothetical protein
MIVKPSDVYIPVRYLGAVCCKDETVGLTRDFQTVGYVHVGNEVFIRAGAH